MRGLFLAAVFVLMQTQLAWSQSTRVSGKVIDDYSGLPLQDVHVFIPNTTFQAFTDSLGQFVIAAIPQGKWTLEVWANNWQTYSGEVLLKAGIQKNMDIRLTPETSMAPIPEELSRTQLAQISDQVKEAFLGPESKSSPVRILNPDKLIPEQLPDKSVRIHADGALFFSNPETGYLVSVYFKPFVLGSNQKIEASYSYFELPAEAGELPLRSQNRLARYDQSPQKFLSQLMTGEVQEFEDNPNPGVSLGANAGDYLLSFAKPLNVKLPDGGIGTLDYAGDKLELKLNGAPVSPESLKLGGDFLGKSPILSLPTNFNPDRIIKLANVEKTAESMQERIYMHTDRRHYWPEENLYFKAYLDYANPILSEELSTVLHLELLDSTGYRWSHQVAEIKAGVAAGAIQVPQVDQGGNFILRAYTAWGQNYSGADAFIPIQILGHQRQPQAIPNQLVAQGVGIFSDKQSYSGGEKVRLNIMAQNPGGNPANAHLSVSVLDLKQAVAIPETQSMAEAFVPKTPNRPFGEFIPVERGFSLQGQLLDSNGKPAEGKVKAFVNGYTDVRNLSTDPEGRFGFPSMDFRGKFEIALQATDKEVRPIRDISLEIRDFPAASLPTGLSYPGIVVRGIQRLPDARTLPGLGEGEILMEEAVIEDQRELSVGPMIYGRPDKVVETKDLFLNGTPIQFLYALAGQVAGMQIVGNPPSIRFRSGEPLVLINGTPANSVSGSTLSGGGGRTAFDVINNLDILTIERVEVIRRLVPQYGDQGRNGIISIILKTNMDQSEALQSRMNEYTLFDLKGFAEEKTFEEAEQSRAQLPFLKPYRPTLYWNPRLVAQEAVMSQQIEFTLNPDSGPIYVEIRGITDLGVPVFGSFILNQQTPANQ